MRCLIGIEEFRGGKHLAQTFAKCGFTRGNPSADSDDRHSSEQQKPQWFWSGFILHVGDNLSNPPNVAVSRKNSHGDGGALGVTKRRRTDFAHATPAQRAPSRFGSSRGQGGHAPVGTAIESSRRLYASVA